MKGDPLNPRYTRAEDRVGLMIREHIRPDQMIGTEAMIQVIMPDRIIEGNRFRENFRRDYRLNSRERYRNERNSSSDRSRDRNRSRERTFTGNHRRNRSSDSNRSRSGSRTSTNRDRIRCYVCRGYDHFTRDCPNSREERDLEHLQHMLNMEEQDHRSPSIYSSDEDCRSPLNL